MRFTAARNFAVVAAVLFFSACSDSTSPVAAPTAARAQAIAGEWQRVTVSSPASDSLTVLVLGTDGAPIANTNVEWSVPASAGSVSIKSSRTDARGLASTAFSAGTSAGTILVTAAPAGLAPVTFSIDIIADAPFRIDAMAALTDTLMINEEYTGGTVRVRDQYDNALAGVVLSASLFAEGSEEAINSAPVITDEKGIATVPFNVSSEAGEYRLVFSSDALTLAYRLTVMPATEMTRARARSGKR